MQISPYVTTLRVVIGPVGLEISEGNQNVAAEMDVSVLFGEDFHCDWMVAEIYAEVSSMRDGKWTSEQVKLDGRFFDAVKAHLYEHHRDAIDLHFHHNYDVAA